MLYKIDPLGEILINYIREEILILYIDCHFQDSYIESYILQYIINSSRRNSNNGIYTYLVSFNTSRTYNEISKFKIENRILTDSKDKDLEHLIGLPIIYLSEFIKKYVTVL